MRKEWLETDYYGTLGVSKDASDKDIKKAFRKLAREYHPDTNKGDTTAEQRFKEINEAYDVIGDPETRKEYDHARQMGYFVGGPGGGQQYVRMEDLDDLFGGATVDFGGATVGFGDFFGGGARARQVRRPQAGRDLSAEMSLSFHDAVAGVTRELNVDGATVKVKIPQGIDDGATVKLAGKGGPGRDGGPAGDLFVKVRVGSHPIFGRKGRHLTIDVPVTFVEAALGAEITVPTLEGKVRLRIPAGTPSGKTFRVREKGVPSSSGPGDLLVTVNVAVPTDLTDDERGLLEQIAEHRRDDNPRAYLGV
jgi:molecular chaperone DnaJ